jgi:hypothetical protein
MPASRAAMSTAEPALKASMKISASRAHATLRQHAPTQHTSSSTMNADARLRKLNRGRGGELAEYRLSGVPNGYTLSNHFGETQILA